MKLRLSYTLLSLWCQKKYEEVIVYYFKLGRVTSPALEDGKKWDQYVNEYAKEHKKLPEEFGGDKLIDPQPQYKIETSYSEVFDLVGVFDILDGDTIWEVKTGRSKNSADYTNDFQISLYLLLAEITNIPVKKAIITHYNQHNKTSDRSLVWNSNYEIERARNFIDTLAPDIYRYFTENDLFKKQVITGLEEEVEYLV